MVRSLLNKETFMIKYTPSPAKYQRRISEFKSNPKFSHGYIQPTSKEVWIDESVYQDFLVWLSENRFKK